MITNPKDKQLIAKLIFRAAMWVSLSDDKGGNTAQSIETRVIKARLQSLYRQFPNGSDEREIVGIALSNTQHWKAWSNDLIELLHEIQAAKPILTPSLRQIMLGVARDVATAFQERSGLSSAVVKASVVIRGLFSKKISRLSPQEVANISSSERAALRELAEVLEIEHVSF